VSRSTTLDANGLPVVGQVKKCRTCFLLLAVHEPPYHAGRSGIRIYEQRFPFRRPLPADAMPPHHKASAGEPPRLSLMGAGATH
jgi:hypothetical protein